MPARLLSIKDLASAVAEEAGQQARALAERGRPVSVVALQVGACPAAGRHVRDRAVLCEQAGISFELVEFGAEAGADTVAERLSDLSRNPQVTGVFVVLEAGARANRARLLEQLDARKDVEGEHPLSLARLIRDGADADGVHPMTAAVLAALDTHDIDVYDTTVLLMNHSLQTGMALTAALARRHCRPILCPHGTDVPAWALGAADLIVSGGGQRGAVHAEQLKAQAVLLDLSAPGPGDKAVCVTGGGVFADDVVDKVSAILPAGRLQPLERALFLQNAVTCAREQEALVQGPLVAATLPPEADPRRSPPRRWN